MKKTTLYLPFLALSLISLLTQPAQTQNCSKGNLQETAYMQRDNDKRCEGLGSVDRTGSLELISLTIGQMTTLSDSLKLQVPNRNNQQPKVRVRAFPQNYQLDPIAFRTQGSRYQFQWSNEVMRAAKIDPASLRAIAFVNAERLIYLPVIFSPAPKYDIILNTNSRAKISEFKILQNNQTIYTSSRPNFQPKGQIPFTWNGRTNDGKPAPAGLYQLRITAQLERDDAPPETASINITFAHNPQWLK